MGFLLRVALKGLALFAIINLLAALPPDPGVGQISAYNGLYPGRVRFPFGESPREAYNFSLFNLDAMFAAHEVSGSKTLNQYRVFVIGDSSVWGTLLKPTETITGQLNAMGLQASDGRDVRFYNLGYPTLSLTKDLLLLDQALPYSPDLVVWLVTLESFPRETQLAVPLMANNPRQVARLLERYGLPGKEQLRPNDIRQRTLVGQRKNIADVFRLQLYGMLWAATGIDQVYPPDYTRAQIDLPADATFLGRETLAREDLAFDVLRAGRLALGETPLLIVNEPILISQGENSDLRYNFYYPRWAYDQYRRWLAEEAAGIGLPYQDAWDVVGTDGFTNSAIHIDQTGTALLAKRIKKSILELIPLQRSNDV